MRVAAVVLAAGRGERFGAATKQLATVAGRPLVRHAVDTALAAGLDEVVVVVGHDAEAVTAVLPDDQRVRPVRNARFADGQSTSVVAGLSALGSAIDAAVILLADQPHVSVGAVRAVVDEVGRGAAVARARYQDRSSHPVAFARRAWPALRDLRGDDGARQVLDRLEVVEVPVEGPAPRDVDEPSDL